jgi:hypothetical protein
MHSLLEKLRQAEAALTDAGQGDLAADVGLALRLSSDQLQPALHYAVRPASVQHCTMNTRGSKQAATLFEGRSCN